MKQETNEASTVYNLILQMEEYRCNQ